MTPRDPETSRAHLELVTFNGWVGNPDWRANVTLLAKDADHPPVIALQEARHFHGSIRGYQRSDCPHLDAHPEGGSTIVLVRDDCTIARDRCLHVDGPDWVGPKHRIEHEPRTFRDLTVKTPEGHRFDVLAVHRTPGGPQPAIRVNADSWAAEDREIVAWAERRAARHAARVRLIVGDQNGRENDLRPRGIGDLTARLDATAALRGIDGALVMGADRVRARELDGRYGGDGHPPVRLTVIA